MTVELDVRSHAQKMNPLIVNEAIMTLRRILFLNCCCKRVQEVGVLGVYLDNVIMILECRDRAYFAASFSAIGSCKEEEGL